MVSVLFSNRPEWGGFDLGAGACFDVPGVFGRFGLLSDIPIDNTLRAGDINGVVFVTV